MSWYFFDLMHDVALSPLYTYNESYKSCQWQFSHVFAQSSYHQNRTSWNVRPRIVLGRLAVVNTPLLHNQQETRKVMTT
jgi:hypothetical protein